MCCLLHNGIPRIEETRSQSLPPIVCDEQGVFASGTGPLTASVLAKPPDTISLGAEPTKETYAHRYKQISADTYPNEYALSMLFPPSRIFRDARWILDISVWKHLHR